MRNRLLLATVFAAVIGSGIASTSHAAGTTDFSDQWWVPGESGWGASVHQQDTTLLVNLFVYGAAGQPIWFVAAATLQGTSADGRTIFAGDLYRTTGPSFAGAFNPNSVQEQRVGTLIFDAASASAATIFYSVDGTNVSKTTTRQTFAAENIGGTYAGGLFRDFTDCSVSDLVGHSDEPGTVQVNHSPPNALSVTFDSIDGACTFNGSYTQAGRMGTANGNYSCALGVSGTMTISEIERSTSGVTARVSGADQFCRFSGRIGGMRR